MKIIIISICCFWMNLSIADMHENSLILNDFNRNYINMPRDVKENGDMDYLDNHVIELEKNSIGEKNSPIDYLDEYQNNDIIKEIVEELTDNDYFLIKQQLPNNYEAIQYYWYLKNNAGHLVPENQSYPIEKIILYVKNHLFLEDELFGNYKENKHKFDYSRTQYFLAVDRNKNNQNAYLFLYDHIEKEVYLIFINFVSTGKPGLYNYFNTPLGWFENNLENQSFRAKGVPNVNGIMGFGVRGMRLWDFGWQQAKRGWGAQHYSQMRLLMHSTDPKYLEGKLGTQDSKGCIRIHSILNNFLDKYSILDYHYLKAQKEKPMWVMRKDIEPTKNPGSYVFVFDSDFID